MPIIFFVEESSCSCIMRSSRNALAFALLWAGREESEVSHGDLLNSWGEGGRRRRKNRGWGGSEGRGWRGRGLGGGREKGKEIY